MTAAGDPRCVVCRGTGVVDAWGREDPCACTEVPRRDLYAAPKPGWAGEAMADVLRRAEARQRELEAHMATCTDRPCKRCERFVCGCGKPYDGKQGGRCADCWAADRRAKALEPVRASVPKRFHWAFDATVETLRGRVKASDVLIARALANPPTTDFTLVGDTSMGKTSLAVAMLDAWARQDPEGRTGARFFAAYDLAGARSRHPLGQGEAPEVAAAKAAPLLLIDDLGSEVDDRRNVLADVIFRRHDDELPTWITTGFPTEQLMGRYGSQIIRRLVEHGKRVQLGAEVRT